MKLSEFIALPEDHKRSTVLTKGVPVAKRCLSDQVVYLYQLHEYYVETYCCSKSEEIEQYSVFQGTSQLNPYLAAINIDQLLH